MSLHGTMPWANKKQNSIALSTAKVEYLNIPIFCDNTSVINLLKNSIQHSKAKYIKIRYHFIRDYFTNINHKWAYIWTPKEYFNFIRKNLLIHDLF
ncbi:hypothetical protein CR513_39516, partial [Mucuna pruriens]